MTGNAIPSDASVSSRLDTRQLSSALECAAAQTATRPPRVLILLACYNGARWMGEQLESILAQEAVDTQTIVRDDGSSDGTLEMIARFHSTGKVTLLPFSRPTGSAAQNFFKLIRATSAAEFDFVAFADQDDVWNPAKLAVACRRLLLDRSAGYSSATLAFWESSGRRIVALSGIQNESDFLFEGAGQGCTFVMTSAFYRRLRSFLLAQDGRTTVLHYHDWAIYALARAWSLSWSFDAAPSMLYRQHPTNDTGARGSLRGALKRLTLVRRGWYGAQIKAICDLCSVAAPENAIVDRWHTLLREPPGWRRRMRLALFCLRGGRRKRHDNLMLLAATLAGWI